MSKLVAAIRSQPWAILPEWLAAIEEVALRIEAGAALERIADDGHAERWAAFQANVGTRVDGTRSAIMVADGLAMLPIMGPIFPRANLMTEISGATSADTLAGDLAALDQNRDVRRILAIVDSPGGAVTNVARLAAQVRAMTTPFVAHVEGMAASAAYWVISGAREISVDPTAAVGSIGVVYTSSVQEGPDGCGRRTVEIVSSNAPDKRPDVVSEDGAASIRAMIDPIEAEFIKAVAEGREVTEAVVKSDFGRGGMKSGQKAKAAGMADRVEFRAAAIERLSAQAATKKPRRTYAEASQAVAQMRASLTQERN